MVLNAETANYIGRGQYAKICPTSVTILKRLSAHQALNFAIWQATTNETTMDFMAITVAE